MDDSPEGREIFRVQTYRLGPGLMGLHGSFPV